MATLITVFGNKTLNSTWQKPRPMFSLPVTVPLEASQYGAEGFEEDRACGDETG